jgi:hypothetical protein
MPYDFDRGEKLPENVEQYLRELYPDAFESVVEQRFGIGFGLGALTGVCSLLIVTWCSHFIGKLHLPT